MQSIEQIARCFILFMVKYTYKISFGGALIMTLKISDQAHQWFIDELELEPGAAVRIFGKYGGATNVHVGFSTGITVVEPERIRDEMVKDDIHYFTEQGDDWFFNDYTLAVDLNPESNEPTYFYK